MRDTHVHTVLCPSCERMWTGEFLAPVPEKAVCKDCIAQGEGKREESPDIHINPRGR